MTKLNETDPAITVTAAVCEKNGRILIARRRRDLRHGGKWEFPGGKLEPGETPEKGLSREMREEFGVEVTVGSFVCENRHTYARGTVRLMAYRVSGIPENPKSTDHDQILWVTPENLLTADLLDADIPIARKILDSGNGF